MTLDSIRATLNMAAADAVKRTAEAHARGALSAASSALATHNYEEASKALEKAEAWLAYLADPSIIKPEEVRNLPA